MLWCRLNSLKVTLLNAIISERCLLLLVLFDALLPNASRFDRASWQRSVLAGTSLVLCSRRSRVSSMATSTRAISRTGIALATADARDQLRARRMFPATARPTPRQLKAPRPTGAAARPVAATRASTICPDPTALCPERRRLRLSRAPRALDASVATRSPSLRCGPDEQARE